ncbi:hypothetical protein [Mesorhizobium escarrei]|uniref:hypothetical protein n=1 Tax=Mesorhizobium escarrei TaxID=666018 RepID=UPI0020A7CC97|nr:hypothetical protein [Mesorhizobium escarrei]
MTNSTRVCVDAAVPKTLGGGATGPMRVACVSLSDRYAIFVTIADLPSRFSSALTVMVIFAGERSAGRHAAKLPQLGGAGHTRSFSLSVIATTSPPCRPPEPALGRFQPKVAPSIVILTSSTATQSQNTSSSALKSGTPQEDFLILAHATTSHRRISSLRFREMATPVPMTDIGALAQPIPAL